MTERCGEAHPEHPEIRCDKPEPCYDLHENILADMDWPGRAVPSRVTARSKAQQGAATATAEKKTGPPPMGVKALVRNSDPPTAHEAWRRYEPKANSRKGRVLTYLKARVGLWVDAPELTTEDVGGFAGTRRLRELRDDGWPIETRPKPETTNTWQHRLLDDQ